MLECPKASLDGGKTKRLQGGSQAPAAEGTLHGQSKGTVPREGLVGTVGCCPSLLWASPPPCWSPGCQGLRAHHREFTSSLANPFGSVSDQLLEEDTIKARPDGAAGLVPAPSLACGVPYIPPTPYFISLPFLPNQFPSAPKVSTVAFHCIYGAVLGCAASLDYRVVPAKGDSPRKLSYGKESRASWRFPGDLHL